LKNDQSKQLEIDHAIKSPLEPKLKVGKQKIVVDKKTLAQIEADNEQVQTTHRSRISNSKKIKIEREFYERYGKLDFLQNRHYSTPSDYVQSLSEIRVMPPECEESLFINKDFLENLIHSMDMVLKKQYAYLFTHLGGRLKLLQDNKHVYKVEGRAENIRSANDLERQETKISQIPFGMKEDPRSKLPLRIWCLYTEYNRSRVQNNLDIYKRTLKFLNSNCTQIGVIVNKKSTKYLTQGFFESSLFFVSAFITKAGSFDTEYFPKDKFFLYQ
jgi:hypothetical protein